MSTTITRLALSRTYLQGLLHAVTLKNLVLAGLVIGGSILLTAILLLTGGNLVAGIAFLGILTVVVVTFYRIDWGFYLFIFMVLIFDQWPPPGAFRTITSDVRYFDNLNGISYLPKIEQGVVTPMELHLFFILCVYLLIVALRKNVRFNEVSLKVSFGMFFLLVIGSLVYGLARGGDLVVSLWETRAFFYFALIFVFVPQIIRTKRQLQILIWVIITGISFKAFQGAQRYASLGFSFGSWPDLYETLLGADNAAILVTLFLLLISLSLFRGDSSQRRALLYILVLLILGFVAANRRSAYASFAASIVALIVLIPRRERLVMLRPLAVILIVYGVYLAVFWNSQSRLASGAMQFKATFAGEEGGRGEKDIISTLYRKAENYNLAKTFQSAPVVGIGFGQPYERELRPWGSDFGLSDYRAHNEILWFFVQTGVIGGIVFWFFFNSFVFYGAKVFSRLTDPYLKAVCAVCIVAVINQFVVAYVDMEITYYRNMVYLGLLMGLVTVLERLDKVPGPHSLNETGG